MRRISPAAIVLEAGDAAQQRRLAATRGAEQAGDAARSSRKPTPSTTVCLP
jgi:hypothetical protein